MYRRVVLTADCVAQTATLVDERDYGAEAKLLVRYRPNPEQIAFDKLAHPAQRMLAEVACKRPTDWPEATHLKDGLDKFSEMVHAAAHAQPGG